MLRQDGAQRSPEGKMRSGTRSGFWTLKATRKKQRFWYTCWLLRYWTPTGAVGREPLTSDCQRGAGKAKEYNSFKNCRLGGSVKSTIIIIYIPGNKYSCLLLLQWGSICAASVTRRLSPLIHELTVTMIYLFIKTTSQLNPQAMWTVQRSACCLTENSLWNANKGKNKRAFDLMQNDLY